MTTETTETTAITAVTVAQRAAVALSSTKAEVELKELAERSKSITAITNKDGREECHSAAMAVRAARVAIEKAGKAAREDATAFSKAVIAEEKRLVDLIEPEENRLLTLRDEWDAKVKAEKEAKEAAERVRVAGIKERIEGIRRLVIQAATLDAGSAKLVLVEAEGMMVDDTFAEFYGEAMEARGETIDKLREIITAKETAEAEAARIKAEQEAEAARLEAERQRLAAERAEMERKAAEQRAAEEARQAEERARLDAERAELERHRLEIAAAQEAASRRIADQERAAQQQAAQAIEKASDDASAAKCVAPIITAEIAARQDDGAMIKLGEICSRLGFTVTADFLASLGFHPAKVEKAARLYRESKFGDICDAIVRHINTVSSGMKLAA